MRKERKTFQKPSNKEKGITLVALVITIVLIIILATLAINFAFGDNGLIAKAQETKLKHEIETARETLTMILGDAFVEKEVNPKYDPNGFLDKFIQEREPNVYLKEEEIGLDGHIFGLDRSVPELGKYTGEQKAPRIKEIKVIEETTNSAIIEVITANATGAEYTYSYKKVSEGEESWKEVDKSKNNTCTIGGLEQGEIYNVKVVVTTKEGSIEGITNVYLGEIPTGTITFTPVEWVGDGTANTTINTSETKYILQYQIVVGEGQIIDTNWQTATSGQTIEGLHHNETVYGRLFDGTNESKDYGSVTIKDEEKPVVTVTPGTITTNSVTVSASATDNESGMIGQPTYTYSIKQSTQGNENYIVPENAKGITANTYTFTGLTQGTSYDVKVEVNRDAAGNIGIGVQTNQITKTVGGADGGLTQGNIIASSPTWSNGQASIILTTNTGLQIQYQVGSTTGKWTTIQSGGQVTGLTHNSTVYARLWDGNNAGSEASVTIKDTVNPEVSVTPGTVTENTIEVNVTASDGETGLANTYQYYLNDELQETSTQNSHVYKGLSPETSYNLKVVVSDNANNHNYANISISTIKKEVTVAGDLEENMYVNYVDKNNSVRKCVVLYGKDSEHGIQIVTMDTVTDVELGVEGDYRDSYDSYNNAIDTLNNAASNYMNDTYSSAARCIGSDPDSPYGDSGYLFDDLYQLEDLGVVDINKNYWLCSTSPYGTGREAVLSINYVDTNGNDEIATLVLSMYIQATGKYYNEGHAFTYGIRPVFILRPEVKITGGEGTFDNPYTLGI